MITWLDMHGAYAHVTYDQENESQRYEVYVIQRVMSLVRLYLKKLSNFFVATEDVEIEISYLEDAHCQAPA